MLIPSKAWSLEKGVHVPDKVSVSNQWLILGREC